jgi:hypothetical protein
MVTFRRIRTAGVLAVLLTAGLAGPATAGSAEAAGGRDRQEQPVACPPDWLGTTTNAEPRISADGRFVVWTGYGPDGEVGDRVIFLRDLRLGRTTVVSDPARVGYNFLPDISEDGNRISYLRRNPDSLGNDAELWVHDRRTGARTLEGTSFTQRVPELSGDGRRVVFEQLVDDNPNHVQIYVRDVDRDVTTLVSVNLSGEPAAGTSVEPRIDGSGRHVLFQSFASDLAPGSGEVGNNGALYVRDLRTRTTTVIPDRNGEPAAVYTFNGEISPDGRFVVYSDPDGVWRHDRRTGRTVAASEPRTEDYFVTSADVGAGGRQVLLGTPAALVVRDVRTGRETAVDVGPPGGPEPAERGYPGEMTPDGRYVTFYTTSPDLDPRETGAGYLSVYVRDLRRGTTTLVSSVDAGGTCES